MHLPTHAHMTLLSKAMHTCYPCFLNLSPSTDFTTPNILLLSPAHTRLIPHLFSQPSMTQEGKAKLQELFPALGPAPFRNAASGLKLAQFALPVKRTLLGPIRRNDQPSFPKMLSPALQLGMQLAQSHTTTGGALKRQGDRNRAWTASTRVRSTVQGCGAVDTSWPIATGLPTALGT